MRSNWLGNTNQGRIVDSFEYRNVKATFKSKVKKRILNLVNVLQITFGQTIASENERNCEQTIKKWRTKCIATVALQVNAIEIRIRSK